MTQKIFVVGHRNPDNDSISAAVSYAAFKNALALRDGADVEYVPARLGPLPVESEWVLNRNGIEAPVLIENVNPVVIDGEEVKQKVILVDHNELSQAVAGIESAEVVEVIDHHRIGGVVTSNPILFLNLPIGSTASVVTLQYRQTGVELPKGIAAVLLSAILTDTVIMKSPTCTPVDIELVNYLADYIGVDAVEYGLEIFRTRGGEATMPIEKLVEADSKEFKINDDTTVLIAQRETVDLPTVMNREGEIRAHLRKLVEENGYEFALLLVTDIMAEGSQFIVEGDPSRVNRVFGIECGPGGTWMPGVLSRKKQVAAPILAS
jgi:manganese-dependent inorganic pyrophosphatase